MTTSIADLPEIMNQAREDLAGNISGDFSPEDWEKILLRARTQLENSSRPAPEAWVDVIRDFHREKYWGFTPDYVQPKVRREEENLGKRFIWYITRSFLITKTCVLYFGARYVADYDPIYGWLFFGAILFMLSSYGTFLYKYGKHRRGDKDL